MLCKDALAELGKVKIIGLFSCYARSCKIRPDNHPDSEESILILIEHFVIFDVSSPYRTCEQLPNFVMIITVWFRKMIVWIKIDTTIIGGMCFDESGILDY